MSAWRPHLVACVQEKSTRAVPAPPAAAAAADKGESSRLVVVKQMHRHDRAAGQHDADVGTSSSQQPGKQVCLAFQMSSMLALTATYMYQTV